MPLRGGEIESQQCLCFQPELNAEMLGGLLGCGIDSTVQPIASCSAVCVHTRRARDKGLRTAALIRFIGQEDGLLSHTHDGPRMYINLEGAWLHSRQSCSRRAKPFACKEVAPSAERTMMGGLCV